MKNYHRKQLKKRKAERNDKTTVVIPTDKHVYDSNQIVIKKGVK